MGKVLRRKRAQIPTVTTCPAPTCERELGETPIACTKVSVFRGDTANSFCMALTTRALAVLSDCSRGNNDREREETATIYPSLYSCMAFTGTVTLFIIVLCSI